MAGSRRGFYERSHTQFAGPDSDSGRGFAHRAALAGKQRIFPDQGQAHRVRAIDQARASTPEDRVFSLAGDQSAAEPDYRTDHLQHDRPAIDAGSVRKPVSVDLLPDLQDSESAARRLYRA